MTTLFHLPIRPYSPIDALNRRAAATGSPRYATLAANANYNGHHVTLTWNSYRGYYVAEYFWAGRVVIARGKFGDCLRAVLAEYNKGALGASAEIAPREDDTEAIALCASTPGVERGSAWAGEHGDRHLRKGNWWTWRHDVACEAAPDSAGGRRERFFDWSLLESAASREDYQNALREKYGRVA